MSSVLNAAVSQLCTSSHVTFWLIVHCICNQNVGWCCNETNVNKHCSLLRKLRGPFLNNDRWGNILDIIIVLHMKQKTSPKKGSSLLSKGVCTSELFPKLTHTSCVSLLYSKNHASWHHIQIWPSNFLPFKNILYPCVTVLLASYNTKLWLTGLG